MGLGLDGACGCFQAKEDEIPTNLPGRFCVRWPHNLYRLRKVIREDRLYRHILVETRRRALLWNTDIRSVSKPSSFSWPWSCLCYPGPSVKTFDPDLLWQLSPTSAGNPKEVSHLVWIQCVCYLQWSNFFFFCKCPWPLQKWWQICLFTRWGDIPVWFHSSHPQSLFSLGGLVFTKQSLNNQDRHNCTIAFLGCFHEARLDSGTSSSLKWPWFLCITKDSFWFEG